MFQHFLLMNTQITFGKLAALLNTLQSNKNIFFSVLDKSTHLQPLLPIKQFIQVPLLWAQLTFAMYKSFCAS